MGVARLCDVCDVCDAPPTTHSAPTHISPQAIVRAKAPPPPLTHPSSTVGPSERPSERSESIAPPPQLTRPESGGSALPLALAVTGSDDGPKLALNRDGTLNLPSRDAKPTSSKVASGPTVSVRTAGSNPAQLVTEKTMRAEANGINRALAKGRLVTLKISTGGSGTNDTYVWSAADANEMRLFDLTALDENPNAMRTRAMGLQEEYDEWRRGYTIQSEEEEWRRGMRTLKSAQEERFLSLLALLEAEHPATPVVALLRLHSYPSEYTQPLRFGDVAIIW